MKTLIPLAAFAAVLPLVPAGAATQPRTEIVRFSDLALGSAHGRATFDRRIARAAENVCGVAFDFDVAGQNKLRRCKTATIASAQQSLALALALAARRAKLAVAVSQ